VPGDEKWCRPAAQTHSLALTNFYSHPVTFSPVIFSCDEIGMLSMVPVGTGSCLNLAKVALHLGLAYPSAYLYAPPLWVMAHMREKPPCLYVTPLGLHLGKLWEDDTRTGRAPAPLYEEAGCGRCVCYTCLRCLCIMEVVGMGVDAHGKPKMVSDVIPFLQVMADSVDM